MENPGVFFIKETKNNIFVNLTNEDGKLLVSYSGGITGLKGGNRRTTYSSKILGRRIGEKVNFYGVSIIRVRVCGKINQFVKSAIQGFTLVAKRTIILQVEQVKGIAHNGVRERKRRRI